MIFCYMDCDHGTCIGMIHCYIGYANYIDKTWWIDKDGIYGMKFEH